MLLVTHTALRTSGWYPGHPTAWETKLLNQKATQCLNVALYEIGDGVNSDTIRSYIQANGANLRYVYIIGDADRPDIDPDTPVWPVSDQTTGNFVPLYGDTVQAEVLYLGTITLENDYGYVDGLENVTVGRLPASSTTEIHNYLDKCDDYLNAGYPAWSRKQILVFDDIWRIWTGCHPDAIDGWEYDLRNITPDGWTVQTLRTSTYSDDKEQMEEAFESAVNSGCGLITVLGTAANMNALSMFYFADSPFAFTNGGMYPFLLGFNCDVGSFQRPRGGPIPGAWDSCVVEKMLLLEDAGIIGAIAPTALTLYTQDGICARHAYLNLFDDNIRTFGVLWRELVDLRFDESIGISPDWQFLNLVLLGDPTLRYPALIDGGRWTMAMSPIVLNETYHVLAGTELVIEAGVVVQAAEGVSIIVDASASLVVQGTEENPAAFTATGQRWDGIRVEGGMINMEWANIFDTNVSCVFTNSPAGQDTPVKLKNCHFESTQADGLRLWGSPSLTQKVENCVVDLENISSGDGLYLFNCCVDFDNVTVRNCPYVNSYVKKVTGTFRKCTFQGRTSLYAVLFNTPPTTPWLTCCRFENLGPLSGNWPSTIFGATGTSPKFGGEGFSYGVSNVISDSCPRLMTIQGSGPEWPVIDYSGGQLHGQGGHNDWIQRSASGKFIKWQSPPANPPRYRAEMQYWDPEPTVAMFDPPFGNYFDFAPWQTDPWGLCGGGQQDTTPDFLSEGLYQESIGNFAEAQSIFRTVATTTNDSLVKWHAATHIITTEAHLGTGAGWIPSLIDSLIAADNYAYDINVFGRRLMASYHLDRTEYSIAIDTCVNLLESGLAFQDSMMVAIDLVGVQMAGGIIDDGGGLDSYGSARIPAKLRVSSVEQGVELERHLLEILGAGSELTEVQAFVPAKYQLYQNYPNPFNPICAIQFDLPENVRVQLKVFNTLGQLVATLVDEVRPAGVYRILWDGRSTSGAPVASGVYIYQLKAGSFADAKKMVLIR